MQPNILPEDAYLYFPKGQYLKSGEREKTCRYIFDRATEFEEWELQQLALFKTHLEENTRQATPPLFEKLSK